MGRMLGAHASDELDRPDLNKCPDCGCFFQQNNCPLCGKECPEEMRAGNRKPVKKKKRTSDSGRVIFVQWYHSWWVIALAMLFMPIVGIALLLTSPHKKSAKIVFAIVAIAYGIISTVGIGRIAGYITGLLDSPVDTSLSREEYILKTDEIDPEDFYRHYGDYEDEYVSMVLTVGEKIVDAEGHYNGEKYVTYYVCTDNSGGDFKILLRDCIQDGAQNFLPGDLITVYGEGAGQKEIYGLDGVSYSYPCVNAAYVSRESD